MNISHQRNPSESVILKNIEKMHVISQGMDIIIVATNSEFEKKFWQKRLDDMRGQILKPSAYVFAIYEDWAGGAGNALGTLFAFDEANQTAKERHGFDLFKKLAEGASIALYHTAGKGTRLAPLPGSEQNSKSKVKLPGAVLHRTEVLAITLLEAVIKQTAIFVNNTKKRLSVFWGDQLFIPSKELNQNAKHHINIYMQQIDHPSEDVWKIRGLNRYGLIPIDKDDEAKQLEKLKYETFLQLQGKNKFDAKNKLGISLGSFSLSLEMLQALLKEFKEELAQKNTKLDTDPHLWMPLTLDSDTYFSLMSQKIEPSNKMESHYQRMQNFKSQFQQHHTDLGFFGAVDIGSNSYWWDYGNIDSFYKNSLKLTDTDHEALALRSFFAVSNNKQDNLPIKELKIDEQSCLINCTIKSGTIKNSVLIGVTADHIEVEGSVIINTFATKIKGTQGILYNVIEENEINLVPKMIRADVFHPSGKGHLKLLNHNISSQPNWEKKLPENPLSFYDVYLFNQKEDHQKATLFSRILQNKVLQTVLNQSLLP